MADEKLQLVIEMATKQAVKAVMELAKATGDTTDELNDTRTAAQRVADALDASTDLMIADMKAADATAEALGQALGPEMRERIGQAKLDSFVADLTRVGLGYDEITANADRFALSLQKIDTVASNVDNVDVAVRRLGDSADRSRSVFANFVGNAAQEVPGLAGSFGPLNMALGQFAEYATEGGISMSGILKTAGPIAALALGVSVVSDAFAKNAEMAKKNKERIEGLSKALADNGDESQTTTAKLADYYRQLGKIEVQATALSDALARGKFSFGDTLGPDITDITKLLAENGITVDQWSKLIQLSAPDIQAWGDQLIAAGADTEQVRQIMSAAIAEHGRYDQALNISAASAKVLADKHAEVKVEVDRSRDSMSRAIDPATGLALAHDALAKSAEDAAQAQEDAIKQSLDIEQGFLGAVNALAAMQAALDDSSSSLVDTRAATVDAKSAVLAYINMLGDIPASQKTEILAAIEQGNLSAVLSALNSLAQTRIVPFRPKLIVGGEKDDYALAAQAGSAANTWQKAFDDALAAAKASSSRKGSGGGGGGGGSAAAKNAAAEAKAAAEEQLRWARQVEDGKFEIGETSYQTYRAQLAKRLKAFQKYSSDYLAVWNLIKRLDEEEAKRKQAAADAERKAAEQRAAMRAKESSDAQLQQALNIGTVVVQTSGDSPRRWLDELAWRVR